MKNLPLLIFLCLLAAGLYYFVTQMQQDSKPVASDERSKTEEKFRNELEKQNMDLYKLKNKIEQLEDQKAETVSYLKENKIAKVADAGTPEAKMKIHSLSGVVKLIDKLKNDQLSYETSISRVEGMLEKLHRDYVAKEVALTDEEELEMNALVKQIDDELGINEDDPFANAELDDLLKTELGGGDESSPADNLIDDLLEEALPVN